MSESKIADCRGDVDTIAPGAFFQSLAQSIVNRGLSVPAKLFLEMHKPLCGVLYNLSVFSAPVLSAIFGRNFQKNMELLFESSENIDRLIKNIEELENKKN